MKLALLLAIWHFHITPASRHQHSVTLNWTASATPGVSYDVYRSSQPGGPYSVIRTLLTQTTYTDTAVQAGRVYYYVATAVDSANRESAFSNEARAVVPKP